MRLSTLFVTVALGGLLMAANLLAQPAPGGAGGRGGPGGGMFGMGQDPFQQAIVALGDLNLHPDFTLTAEQKQKLQAIRDEVKKEEDKWRADHAADLKKIQDDMAAAAQDREQMRQVMTQRRELMQTMPKTDDAAQKVKALLTDDQAKALDARIAERQEEMRSRMGGMMGGRGGRGGGGGGGQ